MFTAEQQTQLIRAYCTRHLLATDPDAANALHWPDFERRLEVHLPSLVSELQPIYGERDDFLAIVAQLVQTAWEGWDARDPALRALDAHREAHPDWYLSHHMVGAVCYADLHCGSLQGVRREIPYLKDLGVTYLHIMPPFKCPEGQSDGGYAVSSYREVNPALGTLDDLRILATELREAGISLVLDFIFNHTSNEHEWARRCVAGDPAYRDFYLIYPDRTIPDAFDRTVREIFPDQHPGAFSQLADGRWVWTTFNSFQWDLNYAHPGVFNAMAAEMLAIANVGTEALRMDAVAFVWKRLGTSCENLPEAHHIIRAFNAVVRLGAPSLLFKSEAIVHPDDVVKYVDVRECQLSYNPLQMALLWNTLATREVQLLQLALEERHHLPQGTAWVNYVRCHDDIGWTFADEDAARLGIHGFDHRKFLNQFYVNRYPGSFARGVPFQDNPMTGDCRISGTCASLCGAEQDDPFAVARILLLHSVIVSTGGIPLLYLGDEVGTLNHHAYLDDPDQAGDSRWVHRPPRDEVRYAQRTDAATTPGQVFAGLKHLLQQRKSLPALGGMRLTGFRTHNPHVLGYMRGEGVERILVLANFSEHSQTCSPVVFSAGPAQAVDCLTTSVFPLEQGVELAPYQFVWLRYP